MRFIGRQSNFSWILLASLLIAAITTFKLTKPVATFWNIQRNPIKANGCQSKLPKNHLKHRVDFHWINHSCCWRTFYFKYQFCKTGNIHSNKEIGMQYSFLCAIYTGCIINYAWAIRGNSNSVPLALQLLTLIQSFLVFWLIIQSRVSTYGSGALQEACWQFKKASGR